MFNPHFLSANYPVPTLLPFPYLFLLLPSSCTFLPFLILSSPSSSLFLRSHSLSSLLVHHLLHSAIIFSLLPFPPSKARPSSPLSWSGMVFYSGQIFPARNYECGVALLSGAVIFRVSLLYPRHHAWPPPPLPPSRHVSLSSGLP